MINQLIACFIRWRRASPSQRRKSKLALRCCGCMLFGMSMVWTCIWLWRCGLVICVEVSTCGLVMCISGLVIYMSSCDICGLVYGYVEMLWICDICAYIYAFEIWGKSGTGEIYIYVCI